MVAVRPDRRKQNKRKSTVEKIVDTVGFIGNSATPQGIIENLLSGAATGWKLPWAKQGGKVSKDGVVYAHKGEVILPVSQVKKLQKQGIKLPSRRPPVKTLPVKRVGRVSK